MRAAGQKVLGYGEIVHKGKQKAQARGVKIHVVGWSLAKLKQANEELVDGSAMAPLPASEKAEA